MYALDLELKHKRDAALNDVYRIVPRSNRDHHLYLAAEIKRALSQIYQDIETYRRWPDHLDG